eukprot:13372019-Alexandrium_andersonii.AAC.1
MQQRTWRRLLVGLGSMWVWANRALQGYGQGVFGQAWPCATCTSSVGLRPKSIAHVSRVQALLRSCAGLLVRLSASAGP